MKKLISMLSVILLLNANSPAKIFAEPTGTGDVYVIKYGMRGSDVAELQNMLIAMGYMEGEADGICGNNTVKAIKKFQSSHGLTVDGICGTATLDLINAEAEEFIANNNIEITDPFVPDANQNTTSNTVVKAGMTGESVANVQKRLIELGFLTGKADGICGSRTVEAIRKFQISQGLVADGICGTLTYMRLVNADNINDSGASAPDNTGSDFVDAPFGGNTNTGHAEIGSVIKAGMYGEGVVEIQKKLIEYGFLSGGADGFAGYRTIEALKEFQRSVGLSPDGVCGLQTYAALENAEYNVTDTSWNDNLDKVPTFSALLYVEATAYSPYDIGVGTHTARGNPVRRGIIAVDPHVIPLGTRVYIPGYGEAIADDTGGDIKGSRIDIAFDTPEEAMQFGRQTIEIYILDN